MAKREQKPDEQTAPGVVMKSYRSSIKQVIDGKFWGVGEEAMVAVTKNITNAEGVTLTAVDQDKAEVESTTTPQSPQSQEGQTGGES